MAVDESAHPLRYSAFISYNHLDVAFARRLQSRLENYRLPRRLARRATWREGRAYRLRPVFRDRSELAAADDLTRAVQDAIAASSRLIVVCSPNSATSEWVGREVAFFRHCHGPGGVLAVLVEGATSAAFHPALQWHDADGAACQPLAADFGRSGDGDRLALLKLVAVLAEVRLDELVQRDAQRRVRQASLAGAAGLAGMAILAVLSMVAVRARATAERERSTAEQERARAEQERTAAERARAAAEREQARGEQMVGFLVNDLRSKLQGLGRLDLLDIVNKAALAYYQGQDLSRLPASLLEQRAAALQGEGEDEEKRGHLASALADFQEAKRSTRELLAEQPGDHARISMDGQSEYWLGFINWRLRNYADAQAHYRAYESAARRLLTFVPVRASWLRDYADAESALGEFTLRHSFRLPDAEAYYNTAIAEYQKAISLDRSDADAQDGLLNAFAYKADILRLQCQFERALNLRNVQRAYLEAHTPVNDNNVRVHAMEVAITVAVARIDMSRERWKQAFDELRAAESGAEALSLIDESNADAKLKLLGIRLFEMKAWLMLNVRDRALSPNVPDVLKQCDSDAVARGSGELQAFCDIERIGYVKRQCHGAQSRCIGKARGAEKRLAAARLRQGDTLTERWGINLAEELRDLVDLDNRRNRACASSTVFGQ